MSDKPVHCLLFDISMRGSVCDGAAAGWPWDVSYLLTFQRIKWKSG